MGAPRAKPRPPPAPRPVRIEITPVAGDPEKRRKAMEIFAALLEELGCV